MENLEQERKNLNQELTKVVEGFEVLVKIGTTYEQKRLKDILPSEVYNRLLEDSINYQDDMYYYMIRSKALGKQNQLTFSNEIYLEVCKISMKSKLSMWVEGQTHFGTYTKKYNYKLPENILNVPEELE